MEEAELQAVVVRLLEVVRKAGIDDAQVEGLGRGVLDPASPREGEDWEGIDRLGGSGQDRAERLRGAIDWMTTALAEASTDAFFLRLQLRCDLLWLRKVSPDLVSTDLFFRSPNPEVYEEFPGPVSQRVSWRAKRLNAMSG